MEQKKPVYLSKTFWFNVIMALSPLVPAVQEFMVKSPETFGMIWALAAIVVRFLTKDKVGLLP